MNTPKATLSLDIQSMDSNYKKIETEKDKNTNEKIVSVPYTTSPVSEAIISLSGKGELTFWRGELNRDL